MQSYIHYNQNRGHIQHGWLNTYHSFSFGEWQDIRFMGIGALRVINEDIVQPYSGFSEHPHKNMEILTYVISGTLTHQDSMGNKTHIHAGEWQLMSAGSGIFHSEKNEQNTPVHLFQIWLYPSKKNTQPTYQQVLCNPKAQRNQWHLIASHASNNAHMKILQHTHIFAGFITANKTLNIDTSYDIQYLHVVSGSIQIDHHILNTGDAFITKEKQTIKALQDSEIIWFDLPQTQN